MFTKTAGVTTDDGFLKCIILYNALCTTLSASDLHNARATILNPFYNMEYEIIKKIRQNTTWIEADILGINLTPNRYNALAPAIVYVSNDVTTPFNSVTSQ